MNDLNKKTESGCLKEIIVVIGVIGIIFLIMKGVGSAASWFDKLPWYIFWPVGIAIVYVIFKFGQEKNWWS